MLGDGELITKMLDSMKNDARNIELQISELSFHIENGTTYNEWWQMSYLDRIRFVELINERIKARTGKEYF